MTTPSGQISLNDINVELGVSGTSQITMNDTALRALFGQSSGTVDLNTGKSRFIRKSTL